MDQQIEYRWLAHGDVNRHVTEDVNALMRQLTGRPSHLWPGIITEIISRNDTHVVGALIEHPEAVGGRRLVGMAVLIEMRTFSDHTGRIEDVIVRDEFRGRGIGKMLIARVVEMANELRLHHIELTSRPERVEANALYQTAGFVRRNTNVYRLVRARGEETTDARDGFPTGELTKPDIPKLKTPPPAGPRPPGSLLDLERVENAIFADDVPKT